MKTASGLLLGAGMLAGVMAGFRAVPIVVLALMLIELAQGRLRWRMVLLALLAVALGAARVAVAPEPVAIADLATSRAAEGVVTSMPSTSGQTERVIVSIDRIENRDNTWIDSRGKVLVYLPVNGKPVNTGDRLFLVWSATPKDQLPPGYASYLGSQGVVGSARAYFVRVETHGSQWTRHLTDARRAISGVLQEAIPGDAGALAAGIVTGDDSSLSDEARTWFRLTGTTHLTAVSGQNVALLTGFLALGLGTHRSSTRWFAHGAMLTAVWLYAGMVGLEAPALRAAVVATLMMLGSWFGRRPDPVTILALTLGVMAMIDPAMTRQVGFLLSASASWALCASVSLLERSSLQHRILDMVSAVFAANIATLPILLWTFGEWSPVSLIANVLLGPVMVVAFPASYLLVVPGIAMPSLVPWVAWIPALPLDLTLAIVHRLSSVMPLLHLPLTGPGMAALVSLPCFGALLLLSRDGERWLRRIGAAWIEEDRDLQNLFAGAITGSIAAVTILLTFWR